MQRQLNDSTVRFTEAGDYGPAGVAGLVNSSVTGQPGGVAAGGLGVLAADGGSGSQV